ncbi:formyltetrahydrofolate deformylase [Hirschia baltica]|uniref:Formyltetrahydrofolate deformylase n=1 Tax=Hirschia baltica (strain ATCC 49814 / DSM 5838 / IFAM 1418) TaxID=582402 RepID=C6XQ74_HIRBI|nr:formyltetrahydrofolate deformylase [Hirschia baltica]ACT58591.1 formyltetrahydrofolate deformylase [Hirschia baltica ATCC 49814]
MNSIPDNDSFILRLSCKDSIGLVSEVARFLSDRRLFITESANFGDPATGLFFYRVKFIPESNAFSRSNFSSEFEPVAKKWGMDWELRDAKVKPNVVILVSKGDHCLNDLLYRHRTGALNINISAIISNHLTCGWLAERHDVPYYHVPVNKDNKPQAEERMLDVIEDVKADLVVLARYMQVLSDDMCRKLEGRCINIHHSFLPSFKGAKPYHQAFDRGVKLVGATAHYVTPDLDEGPIISQAVEPADHRLTAEDMAALGRDTEARVLARAVKLHTEGRIFSNQNKTVVFG